MDDDFARARQRQPFSGAEGDSFSPFARFALFRVYALRRISGEFRRIQTHGFGALRYSPLRAKNSRPSDRDKARRKLPPGLVLFRLLRRIADDQRSLRASFRATVTPA